MKLLSDQSLTPTIADWVSRHVSTTGELGFSGKHTAIAVVDKEALIAGVVYHDWNPAYGVIQMTIASHSPKWCNRVVVEGLLRYPFVELGVQRITVTVNSNNNDSLRLAMGVGFKVEAMLERAAGQYGDIIVLRLFAEEWIAGKFNRKGFHHVETISAEAA